MTLAIQAVLPQLIETLARHHSAVLVAPPGAGKTTLVPPALLDAPGMAGHVLMLEPRRLAARAAAARMADILGEPVGQTVGYRTRMDSRVGANTCIEVVTEGILTRRLQRDPALNGVGVVIFDEFHERSLHADLGLALCLEARSVFAPGLRMLVMSATLEAEPVARLLGNCPVITTRGRTHRVETRYLEPRSTPDPIGAAALAVAQSLDRETGSILVFLPGVAEIRRVSGLLQTMNLGPSVRVVALFGNLSSQLQDEAIRPAATGMRKVVLATSIAETSLTIEGVSVVIDAGLMRVPRFDPRSGMTRLETVAVSRSSANQRRGRAGRTGPGICLRLWPKALNPTLAEKNVPEILAADLAGLALELAHWGVRDPGQLSWLDPPPAGALAAARGLLKALAAVDENGQITAHGKTLLTLGLHPRLAHMVVSACDPREKALACDLAALLAERDILHFSGTPVEADLRMRLEFLRGWVQKPAAGITADAAGCRRIRQVADDLRRRLSLGKPSGDLRDLETCATLVALAYPDRIAQKRPGTVSRYLLAGGAGAMLPENDPLLVHDYLAVAHLDGTGQNARIFLAAPLNRDAIDAVFAHRVETVSFIRWDSKAQAVVARKQSRLGALVLSDRPHPNPEPQQVLSAMADGIREMGLCALNWGRDHRSWQARVMLLRRVEGKSASWPDVSDAALAADLSWLTPFLSGITRRDHLQRLDLAVALQSLLVWPQPRQLERLAPTHWVVPSGSRIKIDYTTGDLPVLAVRLQEMFGAVDSPKIAGGQVPVLLHLLSPARRVVQITGDLAGFWKTGYPEVRKQLRGRYPKHFWPEDPVNAPATRKTRAMRNDE